MELNEIKVLNTTIERILNSELIKYGITYTQATVIRFLRHNSDHHVCQKDIEHELGLKHSTVSSILSRMEDKEIINIEIMPSDKRHKSIKLTERALDIADNVDNKFDIIKSEMFCEVPQEKQEDLGKLVKLLTKNLENFKYSQ